MQPSRLTRGYPRLAPVLAELLAAGRCGTALRKLRLLRAHEQGLGDVPGLDYFWRRKRRRSSSAAAGGDDGKDDDAVEVVDLTEEERRCVESIVLDGWDDEDEEDTGQLSRNLEGQRTSAADGRVVVKKEAL